LTVTIPRIFIDQPLNEGESIALSPDAAHHVARVLRLCVADPLILFNGQGGEWGACIESITKSTVQVRVGALYPIERESPLNITLVQGISRGERMDYTIQKAVELGVSAIVPVLTRRSTVRLEAERGERRLEHWRKVIIGACEQCGRNHIPPIEPIRPFTQWLACSEPSLKLLLEPNSSQTLSTLPKPTGSITLLAGPEGGLSEEECREAIAEGCLPIRLGPRVLRTETAALVALSALQTLWGDLYICRGE
jgi:16S rRNA (uracil1498-N3)-methyltransferase